MISIDYQDKRPIYKQIIDSIERLALLGSLSSGEKLPSVRQLALELSINPNTIQRAFFDLEQRGIIVSVPGKGNFIAQNNDKLRNENILNILAELGDCAQKARLLGVDEDSILNAIRRQQL